MTGIPSCGWIKNSDAAKMFSGTLGAPPTVAILDNLSRELARDSDRHMKAVNNLVDSRHYVDALERLNEALLIGGIHACRKYVSV